MFARAPRRRAVTLLELLLALSLLVVIASLVWPSVGNAFENRRLQIAAEQVRSDLMAARVKAINTGSIYVLWYQAESNAYRVEPYQVQAESLVGGEAALVGTAAETADVDRSDLELLDRQLPDGISFYGLETSADLREQVTVGQGPALEQTQLTSEAGAAEMLLCYPDGTMSTAEMYLANTPGRSICLEVRGLTGVITIGEIVPVEELTP